MYYHLHQFLFSATCILYFFYIFYIWFTFTYFLLLNVLLSVHDLVLLLSPQIQKPKKHNDFPHREGF